MRVKLIPAGLAVAFALMVPAGPSSAQDKKQSSAADACSKASSTYEINDCLAKAFTKADEALNRQYRQALDKAGSSTAIDDPKVRAEWQKSIRDAQRGWIAYKDARCKGEVPFEWYGGTGATAASLSCLIAETEKRMRELAGDDR